MCMIAKLLPRYPQLALPVVPNEEETPEYRNAVLRGKPVFKEPCFIGSTKDSLETVDTPVGKVEILFLANRKDFEHALQALAYRCEPVEIPASVGANTIRGLINWEKIHTHRAEYLAAGGTNWREEFKSFTAEKKNYLDTIILLSGGDYSAVTANWVGISEKEWKEKSLIIRKYHELTHFVCRTMFPDDIVPIRDEVIADMIGLVAAFGDYNPQLAKRFLGIEDMRFRDGGRLSHYIDESEIDVAVEDACEIIDRLTIQIGKMDKSDIFTLLLNVIRKEIKEAST